MIIVILLKKHCAMKKTLQSKKSTSKKANQYQNKIILVVDDIKINYLFIKALLKATKATVIWASNGHDAISLIDSGKRVDLIFMDYDMPGINGYDTTKIIKSKRHDLPIISQTTYTTGVEFENVNSSYDDVLIKPVTNNLLFSMLAKHI